MLPVWLYASAQLERALTMQSTGAIFLVIGFAIGVASVPSSVHFTNPHGIIGLTVTVLAALQVRSNGVNVAVGATICSVTLPGAPRAGRLGGYPAE